MTNPELSCARCGQVKSRDEFHNRRKDKKHSWCKVCVRAYISERDKVRRDAAREARRKELREKYGAAQRPAGEVAQEGAGEREGPG